MLTEEEKEVKNFLLTPIEVWPKKKLADMLAKEQERVKTIKTLAIYLYDGKRIYSSQKYNGNDPDMSDFAVEFYQIIYRDKLEKLDYAILEKNGALKNKEFCGDTMNSYRTIAERLGDDDEIRKTLENTYHSLANFWLLPMAVGHGLGAGSKGRKNSVNDYMDRFLKKYFNDNEIYTKNYPEYTESFKPDNFAEDHFLKDIYVKDNKEVIEFPEPAEEVAKEMCKRIEKRAEVIAQKKEAELNEFFSKRIIHLSDKQISV